MGWKFVEYERVLGLLEVACSLVLSSFTCRTRQLHIRPVAPAHTCTLSRCPIECYPAYFCVTHTPTCLIKGRVRDAVIENLAITFSRPNLINGLEKVIACPPPLSSALPTLHSQLAFAKAISLANVLDIKARARHSNGKLHVLLRRLCPTWSWSWHLRPPLQCWAPLNWSLGVKWPAGLTADNAKPEPKCFGLIWMPLPLALTLFYILPIATTGLSLITNWPITGGTAEAQLPHSIKLLAVGSSV